MALKYTCDRCGKDAKNHIRVGSRMTMYCKKCWMDKKNWEKIHKDAMKNSRF